MVDLGAGTGRLALAVAEISRRVVAVDVSPAMLASIASTAAERRLANVECVRAGFLSYEHIGEPADFVYSRNALHHLPDFWKAIALVKIAAFLLPGGVLRLRDIVYDFEAGEAEQYIERWLDAGADDAAEGWTRRERETHVRDEQSTFGWLLEPMIARAGFELRRADYDEGKIFASYVAVKRSP